MPEPDFAANMDASAPPDADPTQFAQDAVGQEDEPAFPVQLPEGMSEEQLISWWMKKKKAHERWFGDANGYSEQIINWWKAYDGKMLPGQTSPSTVPLSNSVVETDTAKTYQSLFSRAKVLDAQPRVPQADNENKTTVEDLINQEVLFGMSRTSEKAFDILKAMKIEGTGFARVEWEQRFIETINVPVAIDGSGQAIQMQTIQQAKTYREVHGPNFNAEPIQNCVWDHRVGTRIQDSEYVGHRQFPTLTDLLIMQENGKITNVDAIQRLAEGQRAEQVNPDAKRKAMLGPGGGNGQQAASDEAMEKRLDEVWAWVPYQCPQPDGSKKWDKVPLHFMVVNDEVLVMCEPNPWVDESGHGPGHPFFSYRQAIQPREMLGQSVLAPIMGLQTYVNSIQDSMGKLTKKAAKNPTFVSRAAGLDTLRMYQDELAIIPVLDPNAVKYHPVDGGAIEAVAKERSWSINMARETVAANEQSQGVATATLGNATATEASIINANSGTRFQFVVDQLGHEFFAAMGNLFWWMIRQWAQEGDLVVRESSVDGNPRAITRAHLVDDYFFVPITSAILNDQKAQLQSKMAFAQQMAQLQATNPGAMTDENGAQYHFELIDFVIKEIMPMMGVRNGRTYLQRTMPLPPQMGLPGATAAPGMPGQPPQGPPPAAPGLPVAPQPGFGPQGAFRPQ